MKNKKMRAKERKTKKKKVNKNNKNPKRRDKRVKDRIKGGYADGMGDKHFNKKQLRMGTKVEMEHTNDPKKQKKRKKNEKKKKKGKNKC